MLDTKEAVQQALRDNDARPYGRTRTVTAEELVDAAEQFDDPELSASALLELMEAYEYDGEPRKAPVVFARLLRLWDTHPEAFGDWARLQVHWRFKWVAAALRSTPDVPLDAVRRWHTEMRDRYLAAEFDLQPYYAQRHHLAAHTGLGTDDAFDLWATRPRSRLSDCTACEIRATALHHVRAGDDARALAVWQPVLDGRSPCSEEPYTSQAHALLPLLRRGRTDEARSAHLTGYRWARGKSSTATQIGLHLEFCALSGNEPRGLEILAENRDLFDGQGDLLARLQFLTGVQVLAARLGELGHGGLAVGGPPGTTWTADTLLAHVAAEADALAARFDVRNGSDAVGARRRERLARRPLLDEPLALGVRATAVTAAAGTVPAEPGSPAPTAATARRTPAEPVPEDFTALVGRARELARQTHPDATALWQRIAERTAAGDHTAEAGSERLLRAELAEREAVDAPDDADVSAVQAALRTAAELFDAEGLPGRALGARARADVSALGHRSAEGSGVTADWTVLDAHLQQAGDLLAAGLLEPDDHLTLRQARAFAAHHDAVAAQPDTDPDSHTDSDSHTGPGTPAEGDAPAPAAPPTPPADGSAAAATAERFEDAVRRFDTEVAAYREAAEGYGHLHRVAAALQFSGDLAARHGRFEQAEADLQRALDLVDAAGRPWRAPRVLGLLGQVKAVQGKSADAVPLLHRALAESARWADDSFPVAATYVMLGHVSADTGDHGGAVRALSEAAARFDRAGRTVDAAGARLELADVLDRTGQPADAVAVLESVLGSGAGADLPVRLAAQARLNLARGLSGLGEHREAAEEFLRLADVTAGWEDDRDTHTMVACEATVALAEAGSWEAAHAARLRTLAAHDRAPRTDQVAAMLRETARLTMEAEGPAGLDAALERLAEADTLRERAEAAGEPVTSWYLIGAAHYERARAYAVAERHEESLARAERAIAAYGTGGPEGERPRAEAVRVAALVEGGTLGRTADARARLTAAIRRCSGRPDLADVVGILTAVHDRLAAQAD
ncbi:hypothetical protein KNE206_41220 [Kitasatospora sp. NE20-6]|uniref:hypothetical protein n=1 Tax=Kitasatospora sp. NE20-6 TaxID=2859066 RepID=UPI0034DC3936